MNKLQIHTNSKGWLYVESVTHDSFGEHSVLASKNAQDGMSDSYMPLLQEKFPTIQFRSVEPTFGSI